MPKARAFGLSTLSLSGTPRSRMVLLHSLHESSLLFFTDGRSPKAIELGRDARASALFYWHATNRQVRFEGVVKRSTDGAHDDFSSKDRAQQAAILAFLQSGEAPLMRTLRQQHHKSLADLPEKIESPPHWVGFALHPDSVEFLRGEPGRLNRRLLFQKEYERHWRTMRLMP